MQPLIPCTNRFSVLKTDNAKLPLTRLPVSTLSLMAGDVLPLLTIPVQVILPNAAPVTLTALVDCGACASLINSAAVTHLAVTTTPLVVPQPIQMVENSTSLSGHVTHSAHLHLSTPASSAPIDMFVTTISRYDLIVGLPWLQANKPRIDWSSCSMLPPATTPVTLPLPALPEPEWNANDFAADTFPDLPDPPNYIESLRNRVFCQYHNLLPAFSKTAKRITYRPSALATIPYSLLPWLALLLQTCTTYPNQNSRFSARGWTNTEARD